MGLKVEVWEQLPAQLCCPCSAESIVRVEWGCAAVGWTPSVSIHEPVAPYPAKVSKSASSPFLMARKPSISEAIAGNFSHYFSALWRKAFSTGTERRISHLKPSSTTSAPPWFLFSLWKTRTAVLTRNSVFLLQRRSINEIWQNIFGLPLAQFCVKCCCEVKVFCVDRTYQVYPSFLQRGLSFLPIWVELLSKCLLPYSMWKC